MAESRPPAFPGWACMEKIGSGGMATVWKARQLAVDRIAALKVLSPDFARTQEDVDRFRDEARAAASLSHPGLIRIWDVFESDGRFCIAMECVDGRSLASALRENGRLTESDALALASSVAETLAYAWNKERLVHLDIKPENILVTSKGEVKIADFGLSRSRRTTTVPSASQGDSENEICGTPAYMSPEQARGETDLDARADMYSLGATLFHAISGRRLFAGVPDVEIPALQISDECGLPDPGVASPQFAALLRRLLAKRREDRFKTWEEVSEAIAAVSAGRFPVGPAPDPLSASSTLAPQGEAATPRRRALALAPFCSRRAHLAAVAAAIAAAALLAFSLVRSHRSAAGAGRRPTEGVPAPAAPAAANL